MLTINSISFYAKDGIALMKKHLYINNSLLLSFKVWELPKKELVQYILRRQLEVDSECAILFLILMSFLRGNYHTQL